MRFLVKVVRKLEKILVMTVVVQDQTPVQHVKAEDRISVHHVRGKEKICASGAGVRDTKWKVAVLMKEKLGVVHVLAVERTHVLIAKMDILVVKRVHQAEK